MLLNSCDTPKAGSPKAHILEGHYSSIAEFIGSGNSQTGKPFAGLTCSISPAIEPLQFRQQSTAVAFMKSGCIGGNFCPARTSNALAAVNFLAL